MQRLSKKKAKDILSNVPEDKAFWASDGSLFGNLKDMQAILANMGNEVFSHHVNNDKNDFKSWILDVISDEKLAKDISKTQSQKTMANIVNKRIIQLTKLLNRK